MTRTITALFDDRSEAEAAVQRLMSAGLGAEDVRIHDKTTEGYQEDRHSNHHDRGLWASIKHAFLPDEDRHTYEEGVRRGGYLVTADVDEARADTAIKVLEESNTVDIDERSQQWRAQGWQPGRAQASGQGTGEASAVAEESIPIVEEQLVVGKREVDRGGVRVRSYVTEVPVHEQIRLRNERVQVERRPVDQPISASDDAFQERSIELTATGEEAVIGKTARVVEEVRVFKTAEESVQDINDTVRRTDVEIEDENEVQAGRPEQGAR